MNPLTRLSHLEDHQIALAAHVQSTAPDIALALRILADQTARIYRDLAAEEEARRAPSRREVEGQRRWAVVVEMARKARVW